MDFDTTRLNTGFVDIKKANSIAMVNTLNVMAALTRKNAVGNVRSDFINRNSYTERSIQFDKATANKRVSRAGAIERASYMKLQEEGGTRKTKSGSNLAIATKTARGGSNSSVVKRSRYLKAIRKTSIRTEGGKQYKSKKAELVARAYIAERENKFMQYSKGIYSVSSFKKSKRGINFKSKMLYNTEHKTTRVKSTPWLEPATKKPIQDGQAIFNSQVGKLLKKVVI